MKLVATSDFRNPAPKTLVVDGAPHENHIHKGARFSIGDDLPLEKVTAADRKLIAQLNAEGRIVEASNKEAVSAIDAEVALEKKKEAAAKPAPAK